MIIDQLGDGPMVAADGALRVFPEAELTELHAESVVEQQASDQRLADPEDQLHRLGGLDQADRAGQDAEDAAFGAARHQTGGWRLRIEAAIAGSALVRED